MLGVQYIVYYILKKDNVLSSFSQITPAKCFHETLLKINEQRRNVMPEMWAIFLPDYRGHS